MVTMPRDGKIHLDGAPLSAFAMDPIRLARSPVRRADMLASVHRGATHTLDAGSRKKEKMSDVWACQLGFSWEEVAAQPCRFLSCQVPWSLIN